MKQVGDSSRQWKPSTKQIEYLQQEARGMLANDAAWAENLVTRVVNDRQPADRLLQLLEKVAYEARVEIYIAHYDWLLFLSRRVLRDSGDAEDVVQEVFQRVNRLSQATSFWRFRAALKRCTTNLAVDYWRKRKRRAETEYTEAGADAARRFDARVSDLEEQIERLINDSRVSPTQRQALLRVLQRIMNSAAEILARIEQQSGRVSVRSIARECEDVARELGISQATFENYLQTGRRLEGEAKSYEFLDNHHTERDVSGNV